MKVTPTIALPAGDVPCDLTIGSVFFIVNATVLIRYGGFTILIDQTFVHMHGSVPLGYGLPAGPTAPVSLAYQC